jgi:periplasmic protein TonB
MELISISWRHAIALIVTAVALIVWHGLLLAPQKKIAETPVIHIRLIEAAPAPPQPKPLPPKPSPTPRQTIKKAAAPIVNTAANDRNATIAASPSAAKSEAAPSVPVANSAPVPAEPDEASIESAYAARIHAAIEAKKQYPMSKDARLEQPRGVVVMWLILARDGTLVDCGVSQSAGGILDRQAVETVRHASYPPFPSSAYAGQPQQRFLVSLIFTPSE